VPGQRFPLKRGAEMERIAIAKDWSKKKGGPIQPALARYRRYLEDRGLAASTTASYLGRLKLFLEWAGTDKPTPGEFESYREVLRQKNSLSSYNNCCWAIKHYLAMNGQVVNFKFVKPKNTIPYWFDETDVIKIFSVVNNIKHFAMLQVAFFASLRASEVCNLDLEDINFQDLTLRVKCGKGRKPALLYINDECARSLRQYLEFRPEIGNALFLTDYGNRYDHRSFYRIFMYYKKRAGIEKKGALHVFARHSFGTLLIKRGCDILTTKELMRHNNVQTTMRYLHISDAEKRAKYSQYLTLL
jgi:integrase/recombinase XerD